MTQKRKHSLERMVRREYRQFETMLIGKHNTMRIIGQIHDLLYYKIEYLKLINMLDYEETVFMRQCSINYEFYYDKMVAKIYG